MKTFLVTGAASGLGKALCTALRDWGKDVVEFDHANHQDVRDPLPIETLTPRLDCLINCAGVNRIGWLESFREDDWDRVLDTNAKGIFKMSKAALPLLTESRGTIVNITSNAAWMPMRCSLAYNASKAAAHIMTLQLARELTPERGITVFGVAPNKLAGTGMSADIEEQVVVTRGWSKEYAREYQLNALLTKEETNVTTLAEFVAFLLSTKQRHKFLSGCIIPYGA